MRLMRAAFADLRAGLTRLPDRASWKRVAIELGWAVPPLLLIAWTGGLIRPNAPPDPATMIQLAAFLFVIPALGEEIVFRGLLIRRHRGGTVLISTVAFVLWHPLQAVTFGPPWASTFLDPWFLASVAVLGLALGRIYVATASLWPCVLVHWVVVWTWKALLGGPF